MERSIYDIHMLKNEWESNPDFDIENTKGFEEHRDEMLQWRLQVETSANNAQATEPPENQDQ